MGWIALVPVVEADLSTATRSAASERVFTTSVPNPFIDVLAIGLVNGLFAFDALRFRPSPQERGSLALAGSASSRSAASLAACASLISLHDHSSCTWRRAAS